MALAQKSRLLVCSGNHDLNARNSAGEKTADWLAAVRSAAIAVDGDSVTIGDTLFTVCPWWDGPLVKQRLEEQLREDEAKRLQRWIWVHHAPPAKSPTSWGGDRYFGDVELLEWIDRYRPDIVLTGHVHQSPFVKDGSWVDCIGETWVFNAGQQFGVPPTHIIIDTDIGDRAVFSGVIKLEPLAATIDSMLDDAAAYAAHKTHFGDPPTK